ncbi:MAG: efflux RND transporter periplasmic adaptor subunit [Bryobacterales bacterium]|nr:efflux RND transporter periplasmic adaptor subunit [Bryobacterales bacterium]
MKVVRILIGLVLLAAAFVGGYGYNRWFGKGEGAQAGKAGRKILYYVDPMHPGYKSDKPGIAPDCGMKLEPVYEGGQIGDQPAATAERKILHYRDPKDPNFTSDKPGINPETGNDLEPVYADDPSSMPMGTIKVSPEKQQLIGVQYGTAESSAGVHTFRAVGKVAFDETKIAHVHTRIDGWVEKVFVDFVGQVVEKGQPLLTIYSPDLVASQQEYLLALKGQAVMKKSTLDLAIADSNSLLEAARKRLELWELSDAQIDEIARTGKPMTYVTMYSPIRGYVTTRNAFPKQRIMADTELYTVVDLDKVWIMADVFEYEAPMVRMGQLAKVSLSYTPGKSLSARVNYIQPQVDPVTRTLKIRLEANNPELLLKPDMYVDVEFRVNVPQRVTVPAEAVLDSGLKKTVFVDRGNGYLEPRQVEIGERIGGRIEIRAGLQAGERIVTSGNFLIDSESQLKSAAAGMAGHQHGAGPGGGEEKPAAPPAGTKHEQHGASAAAPSGHEGHKQ